MKTFKLIYIDTDSIIQVLRYTYGHGNDCYMHEVGGKQRTLIIDKEGCYPRLMHVCKDGRKRTLGQYPSTRLGHDWADTLVNSSNFADQLKAVRDADQVEFYQTSNGMMMGAVEMNSNLK